MGASDTAERISPDRDQQFFRFADCGRKGGGDEQWLVNGLAQAGDPAHFVDRRSDDREIEALAASDVAVKDFADVKTELHIGGR